MTTITPELRQAVEREGHAQLVDPETNVTYVVIRAEQYERIKAILNDDAESAYPLIDEVFGREGWDDPKMDDYDEYEKS